MTDLSHMSPPFRLAAVALVALAGAAPALAECPTAEHMTGNGVRFFNEGGDSEIFVRRDDGFIVSVLRGQGGEETHSLLEKGVYLVESVSVAPDGVQSRVKYTMPVGWDEMPEPSHMGSFAMDVIGEDEQGKFKERQDYQFGQASVLFIDTCAFEMVPVHVRYNGAAEQDVYAYLPALGLSFFAAAIDANGVETDYTYNHVEVVP